MPLLTNDDQDLAIETSRTFRAWLDVGVARDCVETIKNLDLTDAVSDRLAPALNRGVSRPANREESLAVLSDGGDAQRGRRVFDTNRVGCKKCHTVGSRGGTLGPDLGQISKSKSREQIIDAILNPSADFAPQYQAWMVVTVDGKVHRGLQLDHKSGGKINLTLETGETRTFAADEIEDYVASPNSLMPNGLADTMTVAEFRDLIMYLASVDR
ncbi:c-type cytochrome [Rhodopirellula bahusiensis]|uniref:c-type cytochrome n=1 Tax=Rhodopirellula bahusiensis TaxID=2014065 RepID=UPI0013047341|nr:c-type cytochrome [Rhodopirellula bahusiensis]